MNEVRPAYPVVKNSGGEWVLLRHADVVAAASDHASFSSNVSRFLQIPNGLDGEQHTQYRKVIEQYLSQHALTPFVPVFEQIAADLVAELPKQTTLNAVHDIGAVFAVRAQCAWLGWPVELEPQLLQWMADNHAATRSGDHNKMAQVAQTFARCYLGLEKNAIDHANN